MLENVLTVGAQALVLFLLILVGYFCGRADLIPEGAVAGMTNLALYIVIPCTLISAFQLKLTPETLRDFLLGAAAALAIHLLSFLVSVLVLREKDGTRKRIFTMACTFTNCNFMGFPLQTALLGPTGIFYGTPYAMISPLLLWTGGIVYLSGDVKAFRWRKALLNPGVFGIAAGLVLFVGGVTLPDILNTAVKHLADMAVPLPMLVIGCQLAHTDLRNILRDRMAWLCAALGLLILPLGEVGLMVLCGIRGSVLVANAIAAATPPGAAVAMLAQRNGLDPKLAAELVSSQTLMSIITMPLVVGLAQLLA